MKVADAPITLLADRARGEIAILAAGVRIVMSAEEASAFWAELGAALEAVYADDPERCPPALATLLHGAAPHVPEKAAGDRPVATDRLLEGIIAYAHRSSAWSDHPTPSPSPSPPSSPSPLPLVQRAPVEEATSPPPGVLGRALGRLTRR
jgi:hypothetical protein